MKKASSYKTRKDGRASLKLVAISVVFFFGSLWLLLSPEAPNMDDFTFFSALLCLCLGATGLVIEGIEHAGMGLGVSIDPTGIRQ